MAPVVALLVIVIVSFLAVRVASKALMMTGLSWDTANFQACSAFFGVGFTTHEAEMVVNHPVRRIIRNLIVAGNVGITSGLATLVVTVMQTESGSKALMVIGIFVFVVFGLMNLFRVGWLQRALDHAIQHSLERIGMVHALDYELLLRVKAGYVVSEIEMLEDSSLVGKSLSVSRPWDHGVVVLAVKRNGETQPGIPGRDLLIQVGDVLTVYGREEDLKKVVG